MPHQGQKESRRVPECNAQSLKQCMQRLFDSKTFHDIKFAERCTWTPETLTAASLFWTWSDDLTLTERFSTARTLTISAFQIPEQLSSAYQPFMRRQCRWSADLVRSLTQTFRDKMKSGLARCFRQQGRAVFAVDGSRFELPRTQSNEQAFSPRDDNGKRKRRTRTAQERRPGDQKKSSSPQLWVTLLWHVASGLPWAWRRGESGSSEPHHLQEMIADLPPKSLVVADAGFAGYAYWKAMLDAGHDFVIRVGANITLLTELGYARETRDCVYLWTDKAAAASQPPLVLRIVVSNKDKKKIYFVTSVRSPAVMSNKEVLPIAKSRWGVELFFRSWKQTFDKRTLRSPNSEHALIELDWSLIGRWGVCLLAQLENRDLQPSKLSVAKALRAVRRPMRQYATRPKPGHALFDLLARARVDNYHRRQKSNRNYPRKKERKPLVGVPIIRVATVKQKELAREIQELQKNAA